MISLIFMNSERMRVATAVATDVGRKRSGNEDSYAVQVIPPSAGRPGVTLLIVCDGMGGTNAGVVFEDQNSHGRDLQIIDSSGSWDAGGRGDGDAEEDRGEHVRPLPGRWRATTRTRGTSPGRVRRRARCRA